MSKKERWKELSEQAATEQNSKKLADLIEEIQRLLDENRTRLRKAAEPMPKYSYSIIAYGTLAYILRRQELGLPGAFENPHRKRAAHSMSYIVQGPG